MILISKSFRTIVFVFIVFTKMISQVESFLCPDK